MSFANVLRPHITAQAVRDVIRQCDGVRFVFERNQTCHGSKNFVLRDTHAVVDVGKHRGPDKVAFSDARA